MDSTWLAVCSYSQQAERVTVLDAATSYFGYIIRTYMHCVDELLYWIIGRDIDAHTLTPRVGTNVKQIGNNTAYVYLQYL